MVDMLWTVFCGHPFSTDHFLCWCSMTGTSMEPMCNNVNDCAVHHCNLYGGRTASWPTVLKCNVVHPSSNYLRCPTWYKQGPLWPRAYQNFMTIYMYISPGGSLFSVSRLLKLVHFPKGKEGKSVIWRWEHMRVHAGLGENYIAANTFCFGGPFSFIVPYLLAILEFCVLLLLLPFPFWQTCTAPAGLVRRGALFAKI